MGAIRNNETILRSMINLQERFSCEAKVIGTRAEGKVIRKVGHSSL